MWLRSCTLLVAVVLVGCGGESSEEQNTGGAGGSTGGAGGSTGGAGGSTGGSGGTTGGAGGSTGGVGASGGSGGVGATGGTGGATSVDCNPSTVLCKSMAPTCSPGEVPSVVNQCWGPCVPILTCAPEKDCTNCPNGFCAEYVALGTEYRCVLPSLQCAALACSCLADYFCLSPYNSCSTPSAGSAKVRCECPNC
ncbi:MAG: hypothetical protein U0263_34750 [Polyangiaceae bacterium]